MSPLDRDSTPLLVAFAEDRIVAVADAYDAMTTDRAYRKALPHVIACGEMERCSGTQFDPDIVRVFLGHIEDYRKLEAGLGKTIPR